MNRFSFLVPVPFLALAVACGGSSTTTPSSVVNAGSTLSFTPSEVDAERYPSGCGVVNPPYTDADLFSLDIVGAKTKAPYTLLSFSLLRTVTVGSPYTLSPMPVSGTPGSLSDEGTQSADSSDGALQVSFSWGAELAEIDPNPLTAVTVTVEAFPAKDGQPLTVHCILSFSDAQTLDMTFSAPMPPAGSSGCPAG